MELTRRDAIVALAAGGIAVGGTLVDVTAPTGDRWTDADPARHPARPDDRSPGFGAHERESLVAVARVVYPTEVEGIDRFVRTYLDGRVGDDPGFAAGAADAVRTLDDAGREWHGDRAVELDPGARGTLLRELGVDTADPDPDGSPGERVRYFLVNELLFALYASPTGGSLVGIENPQGHPGGTASYRRGPER